MFYKKYIYILLFLFTSNCSTGSLVNDNIKINFDNIFTNKGFALVYKDNLYKEKLVSKQLDERSLIIFQKNLKKKTSVKITNLANKKSLIAVVGAKSSYPAFNNSVISARIAEELDLDLNEPYVEISSIPENTMFVANRAKTYDEEKQVAKKVPVSSVSINNLNEKKKKKKKVIKKNFSYTIKIADFYFRETALSMINKIRDETEINNPKIKKISDKNYRVYLGPFNNINSLQKSFNSINILNFENIEIINN